VSEQHRTTELSGNDLGRRIEVQTGSGVVSGYLDEVHHWCDPIQIEAMDGSHFPVPGQKRTRLRIGAATLELPPGVSVEFTFLPPLDRL
jgi:hypothetical protein